MIRVDTEGKLVRWYDDVGALFDEGEIIADIQTSDGMVRVTAPYSGRLTEMQVLVGEDVQAGQTIGWIDAVDAPQSIGALIDPPGERKLKSPGPKRKSQVAMTPMTRVVLLAVMMAIVGGVFMVVFLVAPVRVVEVQVMATVPVIVTAEPGAPMPTPRFRIRERVLLNAQVDGYIWGAQGVVQTSGFEMDSGTWYEVKFGEDILRLAESQLADLADLAPTPTLQFDDRSWSWDFPLALKEPVADFPAGTRVTISSAMFNGVEWELSVVTENGVSLRVREAQLEPVAP